MAVLFLSLERLGEALALCPFRRPVCRQAGLEAIFSLFIRIPINSFKYSCFLFKACFKFS